MRRHACTCCALPNCLPVLLSTLLHDAACLQADTATPKKMHVHILGRACGASTCAGHCQDIGQIVNAKQQLLMFCI